MLFVFILKVRNMVCLVNSLELAIIISVKAILKVVFIIKGCMDGSSKLSSVKIRMILRFIYVFVMVELI